ncbi:MAG: hypothetical protein KGS72_13615 [Cyanobacteria bacterium REEB67]|nr:hypothetical protein [Cyanobacteria bacterium REEB67]
MSEIDKTENNGSVTYIPLVKQALHALQSLNPVERAILGLRFGLDDGLERDLEEVANHYGVPIEVIRGVEIDALRKLKEPERYCHPSSRGGGGRKHKVGQHSHLRVVR